MHTINQFCEFAEINRPLFEILKAQGLGTQLTRVGRRIFVSSRTAKEWIEKRRA